MKHIPHNQQAWNHKCWEEGKFRLLGKDDEEIACNICNRVWKNTRTINIGEVLFG